MNGWLVDLLLIIAAWYTLKFLFQLFFGSKNNSSNNYSSSVSYDIEDLSSKIAQVNAQLAKSSSVNRNRLSDTEKKQKGDLFERYCADHFKGLGYDVIERGALLGLKDGGIDLVALNDAEVLFIQCKNWSGSQKISSSHLRTFFGDCASLLEQEPNYSSLKLKRLFVTSDDIFDSSAKAYLREFPGRIEAMPLYFSGASHA